MRELTSHKVNVCNEALQVVAVDEPGSGGANHVYDIIPRIGNAKGLRIEFQNGPIQEVGVNGLTNEALLAIVIDRLQCFQNGGAGEVALTARGPFACRENAIALTKLEEAQHWLKHRTEARLSRGVEGTHQK